MIVFVDSKYYYLLSSPNPLISPPLPIPSYPPKLTDTNPNKTPSILIHSLATVTIPTIATKSHLGNQAYKDATVLTTMAPGVEDTDDMVFLMVVCFIIVVFLLGLITAALVYLIRKIRKR